MSQQEQQECKCTLDQSKFVHINGDETINDIKTFSGKIKLPENSEDDTESVVNLKYIQDNYVHLKNDNIIEGENTFTGVTTFQEQVFDRDASEIVGIFNLSAAHNSFYRGKNLTDVYTLDEISEQILSNDWTDLFIGDYIEKDYTINGTTTKHIWRFAAFDWFLGFGDTPVEKHHIVIVPDKCLLSAPMNSSATTDTGMLNSSMWTDTLSTVTDSLVKTFGETHLLKYRTLLSTAIDSSLGSQAYPDWKGVASEFTWEDCYANIMSEHQVYGTSIMNSSMYDTGDSYGQFPLFMFDRNCIIKERNWFWMRGVSKMNLFTMTNYDPYAETVDATNSLGVRPFFLFV